MGFFDDMQVKPVTFSDILIALMVNIQNIPEISQFDSNYLKQVLGQYCNQIYKSSIYYKNYGVAVVKYGIYLMQCYVLMVLRLMTIILLYKYQLNDYFQLIWFSSHISTICGSLGFIYGFNDYRIILFSSIATYILLTLKHCQILFKQDCDFVTTKYKPDGKSQNPDNYISSNYRPRSAISLWEQSSLNFNIPSNITMSTIDNSETSSLISQTLDEISLETIKIHVPNSSKISPFISIMKSENTHVLASLGLLLTTPPNLLKLISINIYSSLSIINFILFDLYPNHNLVLLILPLFQFLELKFLKLTVIMDIFLNSLYVYEYFYISHLFYPIPIYFMVLCLRFENSSLFQQVIYQFLNYQLEAFNQFPLIAFWLNGIKIFLFLNNHINS